MTGLQCGSCGSEIVRNGQSAVTVCQNCGNVAAVSDDSARVVVDPKSWLLKAIGFFMSIAMIFSLIAFPLAAAGWFFDLIGGDAVLKCFEVLALSGCFAMLVELLNRSPLRV
jgi:predicted RNA-binding Zn-ribbon protein involved in translation (DUF1610 family)